MSDTRTPAERAFDLLCEMTQEEQARAAAFLVACIDEDIAISRSIGTEANHDGVYEVIHSAMASLWVRLHSPSYQELGVYDYVLDGLAADEAQR